VVYTTRYSREVALVPSKVGVREVRAGLADHIASEQPIAVTRHGQTVGLFIPVKTDLTADSPRSVILDATILVRAVLGQEFLGLIGTSAVIPEHRDRSAEAQTTPINRNHTLARWAPRGSNPQPTEWPTG
jgi:hypothetical protein